jgi:hypothetical protein
MSSQSELRDDLLEGASEIAEFMFGDRTKRRKIYHLLDRLPVFHLGNTICARKSSLLAFIKEQESAGKRAD